MRPANPFIGAADFAGFLTGTIVARCALFFCTALVAAGCNGDYPATAPVETSEAVVEMHHGSGHQPGGPLPLDQLQAVKRATARYRDFAQAEADGYVDINVVIPHMGRHFLKERLLDGKFDLTRPELLVYSARAHGKMELVAVEYAVPLDLSPSAPEGFRGAADEWFADQQFKLWTLHAWVWQPNPDGVFTPTNRLVP